MRKRSEAGPSKPVVVAQETPPVAPMAAATPKASAEARALPLFSGNDTFKCDMCHGTFFARHATVNPRTQWLECAHCGNAIDPSKPFSEQQSLPRCDDNGEIDNCALASGDDEINCQMCLGACPDRQLFVNGTRVTEGFVNANDERQHVDFGKFVFCAECGVSRPVGGHGVVSSIGICGHPDFRVASPQLARANVEASNRLNNFPASFAGLPAVTFPAVERLVETRTLVGKDVLPGEERMLAKTQPKSVTVPWGESMFRIGDFATYRVGPFSHDEEVRPGETEKQAEDRALDHLQDLATRASQRQKQWYLDERADNQRKFK